MRAFFRFLLLKPILWLVNRYSSAPNRERIFSALSKLKETMERESGKTGFLIPFNFETHRFIIFSDQHKGRKNGADDFMPAEENYLHALEYYETQRYHLISLGDCEELWENTLLQVIRHNQASFDAEKKFVSRGAFTKIVGNHDLDWVIDPVAPTLLKKIYGVALPVLQGVILETTLAGKSLRIFCTHGHQGDLQSDGNWFSKFFVTKIWAPVQAYLRINPNTPAYDQQLKNTHNRMMYEWALQQNNLALITGHTHQPVFESLTHFEQLQKMRSKAMIEQNPAWAEAIENEMKWRRTEDTQIAGNYSNAKPVYFNTGCCCFSDGDITGIEIADGFIRLIKWEETEGKHERIILHESALADLSRNI